MKLAKDTPKFHRHLKLCHVSSIRTRIANLFCSVCVAEYICITFLGLISKALVPITEQRYFEEFS
jgi:hypothetical protein